MRTVAWKPGEESVPEGTQPLTAAQRLQKVVTGRAGHWRALVPEEVWPRGRGGAKAKLEGIQDRMSREETGQEDAWQFFREDLLLGRVEGWKNS